MEGIIKGKTMNKSQEDKWPVGGAVRRIKKLIGEYYNYIDGDVCNKFIDKGRSEVAIYMSRDKETM